MHLPEYVARPRTSIAGCDGERVQRSRATHLYSSIARYAESIVGVLESRGNAGTGGASRYFHVMTPGAATGRATSSSFWPLRIAGRRIGVVVGGKPVRAPLVDVLAHFVKAELVRLRASHRFGAGNPKVVVVGTRLRGSIAPWVQFAIYITTGRAFPLSFAWKAKVAAGQ